MWPQVCCRCGANVVQIGAGATGCEHRWMTFGLWVWAQVGRGSGCKCGADGICAGAMDTRMLIGAMRSTGVPQVCCGCGAHVVQFGAGATRCECRWMAFGPQVWAWVGRRSGCRCGANGICAGAMVAAGVVQMWRQMWGKQDLCGHNGGMIADRWQVVNK